MSLANDHQYPWAYRPLIASAPMRLIALAPLAVAVSRAGGVGFLAAGNDVKDLDTNLKEAVHLLEESPIPGAEAQTLPIGIGFINWGADIELALKAIEKHVPAAVWFFAPRKNADLEEWTKRTREVSKGRTRIWIQIGTVSDALELGRMCKPDVFVVQGSDAGGHGLERGAGIISLLPEVADAMNSAGLVSIQLIGAGGIMDGRGVNACLALGADGVSLGTRFLACDEAHIAKGYQDEVIRASDGGVTTVRSKVYDTLRGTTEWPERFGGRGIINRSFHDAQDGHVTDENKTLHAEALKRGDAGWGLDGRLSTYAGTGIGLVKQVMPASAILDEIRNSVKTTPTRIRRGPNL